MLASPSSARWRDTMSGPRWKIRRPPEWGIEPVPKSARILRGIDLFVLWSSLGVGILVLQAGALMAPALTVDQAILVSLVGSIAGSALLASAGVIGARHGVPTMVSLRPILGFAGSYIATILNVIQLVGWTAFELKIMADASSLILGGGCELLFLVLFTVVIMLLAVGGPLTVVRQWLEKFAIWLVYASTAWITYMVITTPKWAISGGRGGLPWTLALDLVIAMPISWMPLVSDYNRFSSKVWSCTLSTMLGYALANAWFYSLGAALALMSGRGFIAASILSLYFGWMALLFILVDETDNAFADVYSCALSIQNAFPKARQWKLIVLISILSAVLAYFLPLSKYEWFLLLIGASFVPLFGVMLSEYFLVRRGRVDVEEFYEGAPRIVPRSIISWIVGLTTYFAIATHFPDVGASLPSFLMSALLQYLLRRWERWSG